MAQKRWTRKSTGEGTGEDDVGDEDGGLGGEEEDFHEHPEGASHQLRRQLFELELAEVDGVGEAEDLDGRDDDAEEDHCVGQREDQRTALVSPPASS